MRSVNELYAIAKAKNWRLNPEDKVVKMILDKENKDFELLKNYYCPCKRQKIKENICPCQNAQNEIDQDGHCHCLLYWDNTPIVFEVMFFDNNQNENNCETFNGDNVDISFIETKDTVSFIKTKDIKEIIISQDKRIIHFFYYMNQWYMTKERFILPIWLKHIEQGIEIESYPFIVNVSKIAVNIPMGNISKGYGKRVSELLGKFIMGEKNEST